MKNYEPSIQDYKNRDLTIGDLVILLNVDDINNKDLQHKVGDVLQYIGGDDDNIGCFIHCNLNQRTDFFADRTLKIKQLWQKKS